MQEPIAIVSLSSLSSLGYLPGAIWEEYNSPKPCFSELFLDKKYVSVGALCNESKEKIETLRTSNTQYKSLDKSVLYAIFVSREALRQAGWKKTDVFGINIGSSRGATELFEQYHKEYLTTGKVSPLTSPTTTLGNISSWVAHDLQSVGPEISHSITCSTALHSLLNGVAWLRSEMTDKFMIGGSEAPLTDFTIAQLRALKIYSKEKGPYPCRSLDLEKTINTMILGEGAAVCCLEKGQNSKALAYIESIGYATELLTHSTSISENAICLQKSMAMALKGSNPSDVDVVVMHAPGTIKGDLTEFAAIKEIFSDKLPLLTTTKWKMGHTYGASGIFSLELAILMMQHNLFVGVPFGKIQEQKKTIKKVLINAVGFGGNAVSVLLSKNY